ncbi:MAG: hypothetical protein JXQ99_21390 [Hyphomicrobiaceae bacterium]
MSLALKAVRRDDASVTAMNAQRMQASSAAASTDVEAATGPMKRYNIPTLTMQASLYATRAHARAVGMEATTGCEPITTKVAAGKPVFPAPTSEAIKSWFSPFDAIACLAARRRRVGYLSCRRALSVAVTVAIAGPATLAIATPFAIAPACSIAGALPVAASLRLCFTAQIERLRRR